MKTATHAVSVLILGLSLMHARATNPILDASTAADCYPITQGNGYPMGLAYDAYYNQIIVSITDYPWPYQFYTFPNAAGQGSFTPFGNVGSLGQYTEVGLTVASDSSSGFEEGDVFAGDPFNGYLMRLSPGGASSPPPYNMNWVYPGDGVNNDIGVFFDANFNIRSANRLYVSTEAGDIYRIDSNGNIQQMLSSGLGGFNAQFNSVVTVPNVATNYGTLAGKVLACDDANAMLYIVNPNNVNNYNAVSLNWLNTVDGSVTHIQGHDLLEFPSNGAWDLWFADGGNDRLLWMDDLVSKFPAGTFLVITEFANTVWYNGAWHNIFFWTLRYNSQIPGGVQVEPVIVTDHNTGQDLQSQWLEDATLVSH